MLRHLQTRNEDMEGDLADELRNLIRHRTGIQPRDLVCPREKSAMTPCIARDGALAVADQVCVGCGILVEEAIAAERRKRTGADQV